MTSELCDKVQEAVGKFRADVGKEGDTVTLHPVTKIKLARELKALDQPEDQIAGCRIKASLTCPKDHVLVTKQ